MTTDEKLRHFTAVILESTHSECKEELSEHRIKMDGYFEEHKREILKQKKLEEEIEADRISRKASREFTNEQLNIRRTISIKQEELKNKLLTEVKELLAEFYKTEEYKKLLISQILKAKQIARGEVINIYIDVKDKDMLSELERETKEELIVDGRTFLGGIRAEIPKKNILIDDSFESKLENWISTYTVKQF